MVPSGVFVRFLLCFVHPKHPGTTRPISGPYGRSPPRNTSFLPSILIGGGAESTDITVRCSPWLVALLGFLLSVRVVWIRPSTCFQRPYGPVAHLPPRTLVSGLGRSGLVGSSDRASRIARDVVPPRTPAWPVSGPASHRSTRRAPNSRARVARPVRASMCFFGLSMA